MSIEALKEPPASAPVDHTLETERAIRAHEQGLAGDLLWGAASIGAFLGIPVGRVYYLIKTGQLPVARLGRKTIVASKKKLQRAIADTLTAS
jgi:hypothetical protein